jgi:flagellar biosynthesis protein FlhG
VRHVLAVGGGRGGVGKSMLAVNLGVYLAQLGRTVVLVDADPTGAELHTMLDVELPKQAGRVDLEAEELAPCQTPIPGLLLLPQTYSVGSTVPVRPGRKPRWARRLRLMDVDYVILDLGAGTAPATLDLFLGADMGICAVTPEPPSVEATYRFFRAVFQRRIRRTLIRDRFKLRMVERAQAELEPLPGPLELVRAIARYDTSVGNLAAGELSQLRPRLVVNNVRLRTDSDLGSQMGDMSARFLGVKLDYIGHVEQDDAAWLSVVRRRPLLIDSPTCKAARNLERIARRVLALATSRDGRIEEPVSLVPSEPNLYDVLGTHRGATDEELRRAHKRQREIFQSNSLPLTSLLTEQQLVAERAQIDEAHDTLLDPLRRRAYDVSMFPEADEQPPKLDRTEDSALLAEREMLREELSREINAETEFSGSLLRKVRQSQGIELAEIASRTKISATYLKAIEHEDFKSLPPLVYTRGFVQQVAKHLKLDPTQVSRTYLKRMRRWRAASSDDSLA